MEKFRTSIEVRQRVKKREKIVEDTEGSLPVTNQFWKLSNIFQWPCSTKIACFNGINWCHDVGKTPPIQKRFGRPDDLRDSLNSNEIKIHLSKGQGHPLKG